MSSQGAATEMHVRIRSARAATMPIVAAMSTARLRVAFCSANSMTAVGATANRTVSGFSALNNDLRRPGRAAGSTVSGSLKRATGVGVGSATTWLQWASANSRSCVAMITERPSARSSSMNAISSQVFAQSWP